MRGSFKRKLCRRHKYILTNSSLWGISCHVTLLQKNFLYSFVHGVVNFFFFNARRYSVIALKEEE